MADGRFYTYALAQALSEAGDDYVDTFVPFLLGAMPEHGEASVADVQTELSATFSLSVPEAVIETIATRAKRRGYLTQQSRALQLTDGGRTYRSKLEPEADVDRRINALLDDIATFFGTRGSIIDRAQADSLLSDFLSANVEPLVEFTGGEISALGKSDRPVSEQERLLADYIRTAESGRPEHFETLRQMVLGALVTAVLQSHEPEDLVGLRKRKLRDLTVYMDSNFVFSILELHPDEFARPARELFAMFRACGLTPKVFSFTVDEICRVLGGFLTEAHRYPSNVRIDTLYSALRTRGWTKFQIHEYITHIEEVLEGAGIDIEPTTVNLKTYDPPAADRVALANYKPEQPRVSQNHDLAAIAEIRGIRANTKRKFETCEAIFLTSDGRLSRYCHKELGHADHGTVTEVILDKLLTNILWLKNPAIEAPLRMLIAAYSRDLFVKRRVWNRFYEVLKTVRREGKASDDRIAGIFYRNYIEDVLLGLDETDVGQITEDFVLQQIEKAAQQRDDAEVEKFREQETDFLTRLDATVDEVAAAGVKNWTEQLEQIRRSLRASVSKVARRVAALVACLGTLLAAGGAVAVYVIADKHEWIEPLQYAIPFVVGGGSIFALWRWLFGFANERYGRRRYYKRLREAGIGPPDGPAASV